MTVLDETEIFDKNRPNSRDRSVFILLNVYNGDVYRYNYVMRITQRKGDIAVSQAIATFTKLGYDVCLPVTESAAYDLVIDTTQGLKRIQVKFTSSKEVDLRRVHSNSQGYVVKKSSINSYDWLYILNQDGNEFLVQECLHNRRSFNPLKKHLLTTVLKPIIMLK